VSSSIDILVKNLLVLFDPSMALQLTLVLILFDLSMDCDLKVISYLWISD